MMKRLSLCLLACLTFWMSTCLVTDIHQWSFSDSTHLHTVALVQHDLLAVDSYQHDMSIDSQVDSSHSGVCSYDHGGHMGKSLTTFPVLVHCFPSKGIINTSLSSHFWYSRPHSPILRPPIV